MPYVRKRKFTRRTYRKSSKKPRGTVAKLAKKVNKLVRSQETKYIDVTATNYDPYISSGLYGPTALMPIAQGDGPTGRDGNKISAQYLRIDGIIATNTNSNMMARILVFRDKQQVADSAPSISDILVDSTNMCTPYVWDSQTRYDILYDKKTRINVNFSLQDANFMWKVRKSLKGLPIYYNGSATTDIQRNGLYLFIQLAYTSSTSTKNNTLGAAGDVLITHNSRLTFKDD